MISRDILLSDHLNGAICDRVISKQCSGGWWLASSQHWLAETMPGNWAVPSVPTLAHSKPFNCAILHFPLLSGHNLIRVLLTHVRNCCDAETGRVAACLM
jgi:hypothetical protein